MTPALDIIARADLELARQAAADVDETFVADEFAPRQARGAIAGLPCLLPAARMRDALVAVSEAVSNAVLHAYPGGGEGRIRVKAWAMRAALAVLVADDGEGFDPGSSARGTRSGLGMGVLLMRTLATEVTISSRPGYGAAVLLVFRS